MRRSPRLGPDGWIMVKGVAILLSWVLMGASLPWLTAQPSLRGGADGRLAHGDTSSLANPVPRGDFLRPAVACPLNYEKLVAALLRDLPSYATRLAHQHSEIGAEGNSTVLIASLPDFEPLDLSDWAFGSGLDHSSEFQQVFFTTLERQYGRTQVVSLQQFHWLFLVRREDGWRMALLYSSLGSYPAGRRPPTPPQESSHGIIGQAIRLWLRDCRAGAVFPVQMPTGE